MALVDAAHGEVGERTAGIVVERDDLRLVLDRRIVSRKTRLDVGQIEVVGKIGCENLLGLQPRRGRVARTGRHECRRELGRLLHVSHIGLDRMRSRELVAQRKFRIVGQVVEFLRIAFRIVGEQTLAPHALAVHVRVADRSGNAQRETADAPRVVGPGIGFEQVRPVVVTVLVADTGNAGVPRSPVVIQVVLVSLGAGHVALGELVDVIPIVAAQQVLDLRVVIRAVDAQVGAADDAHVVAHVMLHVDRQVVVQLVSVTLLDHVVRTTVITHQFGQHRIGVDIPHIRLEEFVVVEHTVPHAFRYGAIHRVKIDRLVGGYARHDLRLIRIRHIAVVVAAGVRSGVPRQGRIAVPAETQRRGGVQTRVLRHVPRIVQHHDRLVGVAHARVAELAGLVTHIGVVVVVAEQSVSLVGRSLLRAALRRRSQQRQRKAVVLSEKLLGRSEIGIGVVVNAVHIAVAALAGSHREGVRPAVVQLSRAVGNHRTETVHLVAVRHAHAESLAHLRGAGVDVGHAADAADAEIRRFEARVVLLVTRRVVQSAPQRPGTVARHGVVEADAVQVDVRVLRIVAADVETHLAETVRCDVVEEVLRRRERRRQRLRVRRRRVAVEFGENGVVQNRTLPRRHDDHRLEVLHMLIAYADHQVEVLEVGRREEHRVAARRKILEDEVAVLVGHGRQTQRFDLHLYIAQDHATVARNHLTADASVLRIGREGHGGEHQNK